MMRFQFLSLDQNKFSVTLPGWLFTFAAICIIDLSGNEFSGYILDGSFNISLHFNSFGAGRATLTESSVTSPRLEMKISIVVGGKAESFNYSLSTGVGLDLSDNQLQGEIPADLFELQGLDYLSLSHNFSLRVKYLTMWGRCGA